MDFQLKIDRTALRVSALSEPSDDREYWASRTPYERLRAVEVLRRLNYGHRPTSERLQRILEIAQRPSR